MRRHSLRRAMRDALHCRHKPNVALRLLSKIELFLLVSLLGSFFPKLKTEDLLLGVLPQNEQQRFFQPRVLFIAPSCELVLVLELCFVPLALRFSFSLPLLERICRAQLGEQTTWERARISRINRRSREQSLTRPCP